MYAPLRCVLPVLAVVFVQVAHAQESIVPYKEPLPHRHSTIDGQLAKGVVHQFTVELSSNQFLELVVRKSDSWMSARVMSPQNELVGEFVSKQYEPLHVSFISTDAGKYLLELRSLEENELPIRYELDTEQPHARTNEHLKFLAARQLVMQAASLKADWKESSLRESLAKLSQAFKIWQALNRPHEAAETLLFLGDIHFFLSDYTQAEAVYMQASKLAASNIPTKFRALTRVGYANIYLSRNARALRFSSELLQYYARSGAKTNGRENEHDEAEAENMAGEVHYTTGRLKEAARLFMRALQLFRQSGDRAGQALANLNLAYCYSDLGELDPARKALVDALFQSRSIKDRRTEALGLTAYGTVQSFWGDKQAALDKHTEAMNIFRVIGDHAGEAIALNSIGQVYEDLNEPRVALDKYQQALQIYQQLGNREYEAVTRYYLGRVHNSLGENAEAQEFFQQCLDQSRQVGQHTLRAYALTALSVLRSTEGHDDEALHGLNEALQVYRSAHDRRGQAKVLNEIGRIYQGKGQYNKALDYHRKALPLTQAAADRNDEAATLYQIARAERQLGKFEDALKHIIQSNEAIESLRAQIVNPDLRASYFASVQKYSALYVDLLMKLYVRHPEKDFAERAFELNDNARARSLIEIVAEGRAKIRHGIDPALLARERVLQEQLSGKASYHMRALSGNDKAESQLAEKELRELTTSYQELQTQIRQQSPLYASLTNPQPLKLAEIQEELRDPDVLLLEYALGDETSYVWAVTAGSFASFPLPAGNRIEAAADEVNKFLTVRQSLAENRQGDLGERAATGDEDYWRAATALSEMVLGPVAHLLSGKRLLIVADGKLQYMPFDALPNPAQTDHEPVPLVLKHEVTNLSSASILTVIRAGKPVEDTGKLIAVLADPVFDKTDPRVTSDPGSESSATTSRAASDQVSFQNSAMRDIVAPGGTSIPRLLGTRQEAEAIMAVTPSGAGLVATDFNAGRAITMNGELGRYKIVHFATHGVVNTLHPELSGIMLSLVNVNGQSEDGFLQLHDIYNLDLSQTQLVVLSACRTALGKDVKGEGLVGLTRGFMYAGSKSVIASLWKVDDRATAELMKHFYRAMFDEGLPPSAALRKAKEAMWRQPRWRAPYFWAAFVLQGEYRDQIVVKREKNAAKYIPPLAVALLLLIGVYKFRRRLLPK